jgi:mannose-1-phosphate guanylyltransferase
MRHAVILAGGSGTRLWPASRRARPKQFLALGDDASLLARTARRARAAGGRLHVVTAAPYAALARAELPDAAVLAEPVGRNTAAALGLAAIHLLAADPDAVMGALPSDQHVADEAAWGDVVARAFAAAEAADVICTVGLAPTRPETGFGWLEVGDPVALGAPPIAGVCAVARFVEKPDLATAERYLAGGRHLWNGGMFFCRAARLIADLRRLQPAVAAGLDEIAGALAAGGPAAADAAAQRVYPGLPAISIDHGVMEKTHGVVTVRGDFGWDDVGSWAALPAIRGLDAGGNTVVGDGVVVDGGGNVVVADPGRAVVLVGVSDLVVVQAGDAVLVIPRDRAQDVRAAVDALAAGKLDRYL